MSRSNNPDRYAHSQPCETVDWCFDGEKLASGARDGSIMLWSSTTRRRERTFDGHKNIVYQISWHPSNDQLFMSCSKDQTLQFWDAREKKSTNTYTTSQYGRSVAWDPSSELVAQVLVTDEIHLIDTRNLTGEVKILKFPQKNIRKVKWNKDGQLFYAISSNGIVYVLDGNNMSLKDGGVYPLEAHPFTIFDLDVSSQGYLATGSADSTINIWDTSEFICRTSFNNSEDPIRAICFDGSGDYIASLSDTQVCINSTDTGRNIFSVPVNEMKTLAWNPKAPLLAYGGFNSKRAFDKGVVEIINVERHLR